MVSPISAATETKQSLSQGDEALSAALTPFTYAFDIEYNVILGCPRSGTTFLFEALSALPNSECVSGHLYPLALAHLVNQSLPAEITRCIVGSFEFAIQDYLEAIAGARVRSLHRWSAKEMSTSELLAAMRGNRQIERFVYKEPFLAFAPQLVYDALPNCRIIHIYRDGRDCADSLARKYNVLTDEKLMTLKTAEMPLGRKVDHRYVPWWVETDMEETFLSYSPYLRSVWMWREMVRRCQEVFSQPAVVSSGRVMLLKYEDLVQDPLRYGEIAANHFGCSMNPRLAAKLKRARQSSVRIHERLDESEIAAANDLAAAELEHYGYL